MCCRGVPGRAPAVRCCGRVAPRLGCSVEAVGCGVVADGSRSCWQAPEGDSDAGVLGSCGPVLVAVRTCGYPHFLRRQRIHRVPPGISAGSPGLPGESSSCGHPTRAVCLGGRCVRGCGASRTLVRRTSCGLRRTPCDRSSCLPLLRCRPAPRRSSPGSRGVATATASGDTCRAGRLDSGSVLAASMECSRGSRVVARRCRHLRLRRGQRGTSVNCESRLKVQALKMRASPSRPAPTTARTSCSGGRRTATLEGLRGASHRRTHSRCPSPEL